jgi:hypothetical protein
LAVVKTLGGVGKILYLTHASIYLPLYKDLCRLYSALMFWDRFFELTATDRIKSLQATTSPGFQLFLRSLNPRNCFHTLLYSTPFFSI